MQWLEAMLCCRRWRQHRVVNGSICFPPLEWTHCVVASWVIASSLERQAEEEQKRMYISKKKKKNNPGQETRVGSWLMERWTTWHMWAETGGRELKRGGFGVLRSSLPSWVNSSLNCVSERCWIAHTKAKLRLGHAVVSSSQAHLLSQPSQWDSVAVENYWSTGGGQRPYSDYITSKVVSHWKEYLHLWK